MYSQKKYFFSPFKHSRYSPRFMKKTTPDNCCTEGTSVAVHSQRHFLFHLLSFPTSHTVSFKVYANQTINIKVIQYFGAMYFKSIGNIRVKLKPTAHFSPNQL